MANELVTQHWIGVPPTGDIKIVAFGILLSYASFLCLEGTWITRQARKLLQYFYLYSTSIVLIIVHDDLPNQT